MKDYLTWGFVTGRSLDINVTAFFRGLEPGLNDPDIQGSLLWGDLVDRLVACLDSFGQVFVYRWVITRDCL
jgi:hypothetical protein